jgi:hypothetical protein
VIELVAIIAAVIALVFIFGDSGGSVSGPNSGNPFIDALANAIAKAEGANPSINNPGDLTSGDVPSGQQTGVFNSAGVAIIDTIENGWNALTSKLSNILSGNSSVYNPDMTISQLAQTYTGGDNSDAWASTVAGQLGVTPDTTLSDAQSSYGQ